MEFYFIHPLWKIDFAGWDVKGKWNEVGIWNAEVGSRIRCRPMGRDYAAAIDAESAKGFEIAA